MAEVAYAWSQTYPLRAKPAFLYEIVVTARRTLKLIKSDLETLGVNLSAYGKVGYEITQNIGAVVNHLECDGLIVPSARWDCENLVLFMDNHNLSDHLRAGAPEEVDWQSWAQEHGFLDQGLDF